MSLPAQHSHQDRDSAPLHLQTTLPSTLNPTLVALREQLKRASHWPAHTLEESALALLSSHRAGQATRCV